MRASTDRDSENGLRTWVGRSIRRLEDPALLTGRGRFTADLKAEHCVRFVRSPLASGRIMRIKAPPGVTVFTALDLAGVKPIRPMLHNFGYVPVAQPILATEVVRFVGEAIAAVIAPSEASAEDAAELVEAEIEEAQALVDAQDALAEDAPRVHAEAPRNVIVEGVVRTPDFDAVWAGAHKRVLVSTPAYCQIGICGPVLDLLRVRDPIARGFGMGLASHGIATGLPPARNHSSRPKAVRPKTGCIVSTVFTGSISRPTAQ